MIIHDCENIIVKLWW